MRNPADFYNNVIEVQQNEISRRNIISCVCHLVDNAVFTCTTTLTWTRQFPREKAMPGGHCLTYADNLLRDTLLRERGGQH